MASVNESTFGYNDNGLLRGRTNTFRSVTVDQRDGVGHPLQVTTRVGVQTPMVESWQWTSDGLPEIYSTTGGNFADSRRFAYGPLHRRLLQETLKLSATQWITNVYEFDQGQAAGIGVLTKASQSGAFAGNWTAASTNQDAFNRVTGERSTTLSRIARGKVNGPATLSGSINSRPLDLRYNPATGGEWSAQIDMAPGQNTLTVYAAHPSGMFTTNKASTFTVASSAADAVETKFDRSGFVTNRVWKDSQGTVLRTQNLTWDAFGRLVKQTERDASNNGYNWQTDLDPLGRRLRTVTTPVTNNVALTSQQRVISHYYDPEVEFLEVGLTLNNTTTWKTYGPDLNGVYGGQQGLGGLETLRTGSESVGVVQDGFGNVLGSAGNGSVTWNTAHVTLYGPAEGYPARSLSAGPLTAEHLAYRGKWRDEAGVYYWGARPYDSDRRSFLSFDPLGRDATPDGYAAFSGRPSDLWDPDGRLGKGVGKAGMDLLFGTAGLVNNTLGTLGYTLTSPFAPDWAYENFGSYAEGFTDTVGGLAQTAYDAGAFGSYALISPFDNDLAYQAYGGSMDRLGNIGSGLTGGDGSLAYRIGYGGFNAATLLLGAELSQVGRAGEINFANSAATTLWQNRFPGVQVRQIGDYWAKRVNPQSSDLMQAWGQRTIQAQAEALETLRAAGRPAADSRLFESGRLVVENVGTPLGYGQYLNPYYWGARIQDSRALGTFVNDLRPGNYGAGFRAFDPALDPIYTGIGVGVFGGVSYGTYHFLSGTSGGN